VIQVRPSQFLITEFEKPSGRNNLLKIEQKELENRQVEITVEVPEEMVAKAMQKTARHLSKQVKIPGFRPGKAPYDVIVGRLGEDAIFEEALDTLGQDVYTQALEEAELNPVSTGSFNDIISRDPLVLQYTVPLHPVVELGTYEDLRLDFSEPEITKEAEQEVLTMLQQSRAVIEPVDRPAQLSDLVVVDLHGTLVPTEDDPDEEDLELTHEHGINLLISEETDYPFAGIHEHLIGLESGKEVVIKHAFPDDDKYETLQGRTAEFALNCLDVKSRELPELSDELAAEIGEFESLEDMRKRIQEDLLNNARKNALDEFNRKVIEEIVEQAEILYPPVLLEEEITDMLQEVDRSFRQRNFSLTDQLKLENKTVQEFRDEIKPDAEARLNRSLVLGKIVEDQKISVKDAEINSEITQLRAQFPQTNNDIEQLLNHPVQRHRIELDLLTQKAVERISLIARGEYNPDEQPEEQASEGTDAEQKTAEEESAADISTEETPGDKPAENSETDSADTGVSNPVDSAEIDEGNETSEKDNPASK
jgi:trigger factor